jgi:hypothetical protein
LLNHHRCQQESYAEGYKPASPAAGDIKDAFPPAATSKVLSVARNWLDESDAQVQS